MKRVAIAGGGITGLSAAYYLEQARRNGAPLEWTLFEKSERLGGVIQTGQRDGYVLEAGPDSFLSAKPDASSLCRDLGLGDQFISSKDSERKTYILVKGRLVPLPDGLEFMVPTRVWPMATTRLFSLGAKLRMAAERFGSGTCQNGDESVGSFVRRHFGQEMVDRVAEPLLAGVYGGDAERLSMRAVLPRFVEMEREHGSLVRASLQARKARAQSGSTPQPLFTSLRNGMQQITDALIAALPASSLRLRQPVTALQRDGGWKTESGEKFDHVLLAVPAPVSSSLLKPLQVEVAEMLAHIQYTSSSAVLLACEAVELPLGFGFLVPGAEGRKLLACTFVHRKFPHRTPDNGILLRCFFSSARMPDLVAHSDDDLQDLAQKELNSILGLKLQPRFMQTFRSSIAMPQYEVGHLERVARIESLLGEMPGLQITGNSLYGIGVPDCIKSGRQAAEKIISSSG